MQPGNTTWKVNKCSACGKAHKETSLVTGKGNEEIAVCPTTNEVILRMDVEANDPTKLSLSFYPEKSKDK